MPAWLRFVLLLIVFFGLDAAVMAVVTHTGVVGALLFGAAGAVLAVLLYVFVIRRFEHRPVTELSPEGRWRGLRTGTLIGIGLFTVAILLMAIFGAYRLDGWGSVGGFLGAAGLMAAAAVLEEILFRGVLFRYVEGWTGTRWALVVSAAVFGLLHLVNPGATIGGALAVMVAGTMLAGAYVKTRSLWLPIGLHFGWNFAESGIFGTTVSGSAGDHGGLLRATFDGPAVLTGGSFGPEASLLAILVVAAAAAYFLRSAAVFRPAAVRTDA
jgi:membrane protease YdiL (CAAX protease family)